MPIARDPANAPPGPAVMTVAELNRNARRLLEQSFPLAWIAGEISNLTQAASGHLYFSLKDREAQVHCVMFRNRWQQLDWIPVNGAQIEVRALVTLYEARGDFQLNIETMRRAGQGALFEAFQKLKQKLDAEGLFDASRKKPLPRFPRQVGIVTSLAAAALRDVLTTLRRRNPGIPVVIYPSPVQGEGAAASLAAAVANACRRAECDVLILCRGGGSIEDLWAFNDEALARTIASCRIPIISGVGHETDFTIVDFVADLRAPTPTAAAAAAVPDRDELATALGSLARQLAADLRRLLQTLSQRLDNAALRLQHPGARVADQERALAQLRRRLSLALATRTKSLAVASATLRGRLLRASPDVDGMAAALQRVHSALSQALRGTLRTREARLSQCAASLLHLDPNAVLARGYSMVRDAEGILLRDSRKLRPGDPLSITFASGWASAEVKQSGD